jgi:LysM repeat protein
MNFASHSSKNKATRQCASFSLDIEMPKGYFFAVLDFTTHDYANLDASLAAKLQTIASSFTSVSSFSADLFLGFMAKEINNFVHNLAEQSGGPELRCSAALCWLNDNALSHLLRGDATISVRNGEQASQIGSVRGAKLGAGHLDAPVSGEVEVTTLNEDDVVFIMTKAVSDLIAGQALPADAGLDAQATAESVLQSTESATGDRAFIVIRGPYAPPLDAVSANELRSSVAALEARLNALGSAGVSGSETAVAAVVARQIDEQFGQRNAELKDHLSNKPSTLDFLELDEKVKSLQSLLAGKAESADVQELRHDLLKFDAAQANAAASVSEPEVVQSRRGSLLPTALLLLALAAGAGFLGSWLALRRASTRPEVWSVKTSGNEISLRREDVNSEQITLPASHALPVAEQRFSSFGDAQRYIATVTGAAAPSSQTPSAATSPSPESTAEITIKPGDSLKKIAQLYNIPEEKVKALNPEIKRWELIQTGQKVVVPSAAPTPSPSPSPAADQPPATNTTAEVTEVTVGPGDSLNELARRFNTTATRLKELNPQMNWPRIHVGQKVMVPSPAGG